MNTLVAAAESKTILSVYPAQLKKILNVKFFMNENLYKMF